MPRKGRDHRRRARASASPARSTGRAPARMSSSRAQQGNSGRRREAAQGGRQGRSARGDVADKPDGGEDRRRHLKRHGRIDILVNSAASTCRNATSGTFRSTADQIVAITCGHVLLLPRVLRACASARKAWSSTSLVAGRYASTLTGPGYNATKHAVVALTESLNMRRAPTASAHLDPARRVRRRSSRSARCRRLRTRRAHAAGEDLADDLFIATLPRAPA